MSDRIGEVRAAFADVDLRQLRNAFAFGVAYGRALEREVIDGEDAAIHRAAVAAVARHVSWDEARRSA